MEEKKAMEQAEAELDAILEEENNSDELAA